MTGQSMWDFLSEMQLWDRFLYECFCPHIPKSFHQYSIIIYSLITDGIYLTLTTAITLNYELPHHYVYVNLQHGSIQASTSNKQADRMVGNGDFEDFIGLRQTTFQYTRSGTALRNWQAFFRYTAIAYEKKVKVLLKNGTRAKVDHLEQFKLTVSLQLLFKVSSTSVYVNRMTLPRSYWLYCNEDYVMNVLKCFSTYLDVRYVVTVSSILKSTFRPLSVHWTIGCKDDSFICNTLYRATFEL